MHGDQLQPLSPADDRDRRGHTDGGHRDHDHDHDHPHGGHGAGWRHWWSLLRHSFAPHSHDPAERVDDAARSSREGIRAVWVSLVVLAVTAAAQAVVVVVSGSVALLGDTLHNLTDALTAVPLGIAFVWGRRAATRRYTYGYGRAEDIAGVVIVAVIAASAVLAAVEAVGRLLHPAPVSHLPLVAVAALIGFAGNEAVAVYRMRVGRRIGSAALVADGLHARADGLTSLAVLFGAAGVALGWWWADPAAGLLITAAILYVLRDAARAVYQRLMDAVDPALVDQVEAVLRGTPSVLGVGQLRLRWIGHQLRAECEITVDGAATVVAAHAIAHDAERRLIAAVPRLTAAIVHAEPDGADRLAHHEPVAGIA